MRHDNGRSPDQIQADIARTRANIDATLSAIENRLSREQLTDQAWDYLRNNGATQYLSNLQGSVKDNPLPVTLVGIGLAWLMTADRSQRRRTSEGASMTDGHTSLGERVADLKATAHSARERISESTQAARERISDTTDATRERAKRVAEGTRHQWDRAREGYSHLLHEQPLALGAVGVALGALVAAVLPRTDKEDELLGEARDRLAESAKAVGEEQLEKAQRVASAAGSAAADEAQRQTSSSAGSERLQGSESGEQRAPIVGGEQRVTSGM